MKKHIIFGSFIAVLLACVYLWVGSQNTQARGQEDTPQRPLAGVTVYTVRAHEEVFKKDLAGRTSAFQVSEIRPQVTGIILKRLFTEGSLVKKGQQLYQIDPAMYQAAYDSAAASLGKAHADLKAVAPKVKRYTRLVQMGGVSHQQYDDAVAALAQAEAGVAVARAQLATAKINLDYTRVFSPISGRIGRSSVTEGALVTANQAMALATVQNLDQIYVDVNQSSDEIMALRRQMKAPSHSPAAVLFLGKGDTPYGTGKILFSDVTVDQGTGTVQLRILFPNPENDLLPGLFVRARVELFRKARAITVPQQAVVRRADGSVSVWTVDKNDIVQPREIVVSKTVRDQWLVTKGLAPGDRVVVAGLQKIRAQVKVSPEEMLPASS